MRLAIASALLLSPAVTWAASSRLIVTAVGQEAPVGVYAVVRRDCSVGAAPDIHVLRAPVHGAVLVHDVQLATKRASPCNPVTAPAHRVTYRPEAGFSGQDELLFEIVDRDTGQTDPHPVTIIVQAAPAAI